MATPLYRSVMATLTAAQLTEFLDDFLDGLQPRVDGDDQQPAARSRFGRLRRS